MVTSVTASMTDEEIIALEHAYWDAVKANDLDATLALTYDPCIVMGAQGAATFDHAAMTKMMEKKTWTLKDYRIDKMNVLAVSENVAVLGYTVTLDMDVDGKALSMDCAESSTWVKHGRKWQCVLHSESPLGDPFGSDKKPAKTK